MKYGLWEGGKRVKWFDEQSIKLINQQTLDYTTFFSEEQSSNHVKPNATFTPPHDFESKLSNIKRKLNVPTN